MWEYDTLELLQDFVREPLSIRTIRMFMDHFELNIYELPIYLRSATNLALVCSDTDYAITSEDLMWLSCIDNVALCRGEDRNLFFSNLTVDPEEYYIACAAAIKIFNILFPGNNQYIFKVGNALASGCKRDFSNHTTNNFCVTQLFAYEELKEYVYFLEEALLSDEEALPYLVMQYSPQERLFEKVSNRLREISLDYITVLQEINSAYGIDISKEYTRYIESFTQSLNATITYADACAILHYVGTDMQTSSYDVLEDALNQANRSPNSDSTSVPIEHIINDDSMIFSQEAFDDAEKMLKEMLDR